MARAITSEYLQQHKATALQALSEYMDSLIDSNDSRLQSKADKLSYWLEDWATFLAFEPSFSPSSLKRYKRGEVIKIHLGFNIGSEEGGLHYAVVLDKNNPLHSPVVTIAPLTSVKPNTDVSNLHSGSVFLGNELYASLNAKVSALQRLTDTERKTLQEMTGTPKHILNAPDSEIDAMAKHLDHLMETSALLKRTKKEISKMKTGSIALVGQVRTISKIRIYDPKNNLDVLSGIKLSNEKLDLIDHELVSLYTGMNKTVDKNIK